MAAAEAVAEEEEVEGAQTPAATVLLKARAWLPPGPSVSVQEHPELVYYTSDTQNFLKTRLQFHSSGNNINK